MISSTHAKDRNVSRSDLSRGASVLMYLRTTALAVLIMCGTACKEDPEMVEKHAKQQAELRDLQARLEDVNAQLRNMPEDVSHELKAAEQKLEELTAETKKLETEAIELQQRKAELEKQLADYRSKYPIP